MIFVKVTQNFIKSPLNICLISQISVHSLWHVWHHLYIREVADTIYVCDIPHLVFEFTS